MNIWHDISRDRIKCDDFVAVIEIEKGSKMKYELDKETGLLLLDRILFTSTHYPASYGFIPRTLADDGDPMDVLILTSEPLLPLSLVRCYPIGVITMNDNGAMDEKIIAIPFNDPMYNCYKSIDVLGNIWAVHFRYGGWFVFQLLVNAEEVLHFLEDVLG